MINIQLSGDNNTLIDANISIHGNLVILDAPFISAQWPLDAVGILLTTQTDNIIKLGFYNTGWGTCALSYQSFYFDSEYYDTIDAFFIGLGFPMPQTENEIAPAVELQRIIPVDSTNEGV